MPNPLYDSLYGSRIPMRTPAPMPANPMQAVFQKVQQIQQAFRDPSSFISQAFPYIPKEISNNPDMILNYMLQQGKLTKEQLAQASELSKYAGLI